MKNRELGNSGLSVTELGLGCNWFSINNFNNKNLNLAVTRDAAKGMRYPETMMKSVNG